MLRSTPITMALLVVALAACDSAPTAPTGAPGPSNGTSPVAGPNFSWNNNPDNGNIRIVRYQTDFALSWTDPRTGLRATHTTFPIGNEPDCGPQEVLDPIDGQDVGLADLDDFLRSWLHVHYDGELYIIVRDLNTPGSCYGAALVAQGMGRLRLNDNDAFAWYPSGRNNDNAFSYQAVGTLTGVDGGRVHYNGLMHVVWDPQAGDPGAAKYIERTQVNVN